MLAPRWSCGLSRPAASQARDSDRDRLPPLGSRRINIGSLVGWEEIETLEHTHMDVYGMKTGWLVVSFLVVVSWASASGIQSGVNCRERRDVPAVNCAVRYWSPSAALLWTRVNPGLGTYTEYPESARSVTHCAPHHQTCSVDGTLCGAEIRHAVDSGGISAPILITRGRRRFEASGLDEPVLT